MRKKAFASLRLSTGKYNTKDDITFVSREITKLLSNKFYDA
jgi:cysteine sulfinate desulfinase/cysteine desulfurase-like protein